MACDHRQWILGSSFCPFRPNQPSFISYIQIYPKIWVRQLGWLFPIPNKWKNKIPWFETTNQWLLIPPHGKVGVQWVVDICALPTRQTAIYILLLSFGFHAFETVLGEALVHVLYWCCPSKKILKHQSCCHAIFWSQAATSSKKDLKVLALGEGPPLPLLARQGKPS